MVTTMDALSALKEYDARRDFSEKAFRSACYAPHTSLYFDTAGDVRVCCHNWSHLAGSISRQTIREIWEGEGIRKIRRAVEAYNFEAGCGFCKWQLAADSLVNLPMAKWDLLPVASEDEPWPSMMEFSMSNTCNLECIMCNGIASSAIRAHREKLPPVISPYTDRFFEELRAFLPHLRRAKFLGGEPFLEAECLRIWTMLIEDGIRLPCHVTTNGTQFNRTVERLLTQIPFGIAISVDGYRKQTIEKIRVNVRYNILMQNVARFRAYTRAQKTSFGLTYCLMRPNWEEFGDFCLFADSLECPVWVNQVRRPPELSLYSLPLDELTRIAESLARQSVTLAPQLKQNRPVWEAEVERIRKRSSGAAPITDQVQRTALTKPPK